MDATLQTQAPRRTRAAAYRERIQIRLALDECGPLIAEILKENGIELPGMSWEKVWPHWLIACDRDAAEGSSNEVIGCVMVLPGKPFGYLEFLFAKPSAGMKMRAIAIQKLLAQGIGTLKIGGAAYVVGMVDGKNQKFYNILSKIGFVSVSPHMAMVKRIK